MSRIVSLHLRPRYAETDQMGIVYYANYLVWFECGRSEYMRAVGMPYTELERRGYYFPVTEFQCRLTASARYDEEITVHTRVQDLKSRQLCYAYEVTRQEQSSWPPAPPRTCASTTGSGRCGSPSGCWMG